MSLNNHIVSLRNHYRVVIISLNYRQCLATYRFSVVFLSLLVIFLHSLSYLSYLNENSNNTVQSKRIDDYSRLVKILSKEKMMRDGGVVSVGKRLRPRYKDIILKVCWHLESKKRSL